jgi:hypothetical protein
MLPVFPSIFDKVGCKAILLHDGGDLPQARPGGEASIRFELEKRSQTNGRWI